MATTFSGARISLIRALIDRAHWVEERLDNAKLYRVPQGEETLTQSVLLDLKMALPRLTIRVFSRQEESQEFGADWMWWWEGQDRWFGHLVQAKRLQQLTKDVDGYTIGYRPATKDSKKPKDRQIDTLLKAAAQEKMPAIYALYNSSTPGHRRAGYCPHVRRGASAEGVTMLSADVAKALLHQVATAAGRDPQAQVGLALDEVAEDARPWSCLAACTAFTCTQWPLLSSAPWTRLGVGLRSPADDLAAGAATALLLARFSGRRRQALSVDDDIAAGVDYVSQGFRPERPVIVSSLLEEQLGRNLESEFFRALPESVRGVVVIQPRPTT